LSEALGFRHPEPLSISLLKCRDFYWRLGSYSLRERERPAV
jgi:hypothetical protein